MNRDPDPQEEELIYYRPQGLETLQNEAITNSTAGPYFPRNQYAHLRNVSFDLEKANLTDKQMIAISLVFYAGVTRRGPAQAMKITLSALKQHLQAALRKIKESFR